MKIFVKEINQYILKSCFLALIFTHATYADKLCQQKKVKVSKGKIVGSVLLKAATCPKTHAEIFDFDSIMGVKGDAGAAGANGANGTNGSSGPTGPTGPAGSNGAIGPIGPTGATGPTGAAGILKLASCYNRIESGFSNSATATVTASCNNTTTEFVLNYSVLTGTNDVVESTTLVTNSFGVLPALPISVSAASRDIAGGTASLGVTIVCCPKT